MSANSGPADLAWRKRSRAKSSRAPRLGKLPLLMAAGEMWLWSVPAVFLL